MAANPRLEINVAKIASNAAQVVQKASAAGVKVVGVTKVCCGAPEVARAIKQGGVAMLGDSRLENIARMRDAGIPGPYMLIRIPMQSAAAETVRLADYCLLSDVTTGKVLGAEARRQGKTMRVVIMVDVGDLREGFWPDEIPGAVNELAAVEGLEIAGLGVNLTCYGAISPDENNLGLLVRLAEEIRKNNKLELPIVSGGNSSSLGMMWEGKL
ncbi:MAG: alanine racemase, partial [Bacillota bacterium]